MEIIITKGEGTGSTKISAFDQALYKAGIANYNLIYLSSIIPSGSTIKAQKIDRNEKEYGHRLYVVMAKNIQTTPGKEAWAGIGWMQTKDGRGFFTEHIGESKEEVISLIKKTTQDVRVYRTEKYGEVRYVTSGIKCMDKIACAIVAAVYQSEGWKTNK